MKNGLYSIHIQWLDGVRGRASGVILLRNGSILGGDPYFWSQGSYTVQDGGNWKGELVTRQHTPYRDQSVRPVFGGDISTAAYRRATDIADRRRCPRQSADRGRVLPEQDQPGLRRLIASQQSSWPAFVPAIHVGPMVLFRPVLH